MFIVYVDDIVIIGDDWETNVRWQKKSGIEKVEAKAGGSNPNLTTWQYNFLHDRH